MKKIKRTFIAYALTVPPIIIFCLIMIISGIATPFIECFSVDSSDRIYVGTQGKISVFSDGELIDTLSPKTSSAYVFTITENDQIILATSTKIYTMDLQGNVLHEEAEYDAFNQLSYKKRKFVSKNGDEYIITNQLARSSIVKNGTETVFKISPLSMIVKILLAVSIIMLISFVTWVVTQKLKTDMAAESRSAQQRQTKDDGDKQPTP